MQAPDPTTKLGKGFAIIAWLLLLAVIYLFFDDYLAAQLNPNQQLKSTVGAGGERTVNLIANRQGHYVGTLKLNGQNVDFLLDTGATMVAVSADVARRTGMIQGRAYQTATANGIATVYQSQIDQLQLGDIVLTNLNASIVPNLTGSEILLGMSALKHLEFAQQANQLQLTQRN
ncbi:MAG: retroviral-like aspartic protease family protein [Gammaproteobacteria bacterium]|nr:retroviral-like aspartic protease family protein [Gammaproteobacteria bacterium]